MRMIEWYHVQSTMQKWWKKEAKNQNVKNLNQSSIADNSIADELTI